MARLFRMRSRCFCHILVCDLAFEARDFLTGKVLQRDLGPDPEPDHCSQVTVHFVIKRGEQGSAHHVVLLAFDDFLVECALHFFLGKHISDFFSVDFFDETHRDLAGPEAFHFCAGPLPVQGGLEVGRQFFRRRLDFKVAGYFADLVDTGLHGMVFMRKRWPLSFGNGAHAIRKRYIDASLLWEIGMR